MLGEKIEFTTKIILSTRNYIYLQVYNFTTKMRGEIFINNKFLIIYKNLIIAHFYVIITNIYLSLSLLSHGLYINECGQGLLFIKIEIFQ